MPSTDADIAAWLASRRLVDVVEAFRDESMMSDAGFKTVARSAAPEVAALLGVSPAKAEALREAMDEEGWGATSGPGPSASAIAARAW